MYAANGFLLGLSTGVACVAFCGPVILPYLLTEGHTVKNSITDVLWFLGGRLIAYILTGFLAGLLGSAILKNSLFMKISGGWLYIILSISLIIYAFYRHRHACLGEKQERIAGFLGIQWPHIMPVLGGFTSGINLCPPFLLAITQAGLSQNPISGTIFFISF